MLPPAGEGVRVEMGRPHDGAPGRGDVSIIPGRWSQNGH